MLRWVHVAPFLVIRKSELQLRYLGDPDGRTVLLLERMCRLVRRLQGRPRACVLEALRRQERRVKDSRRLAGVAKTLVDLCVFEAPKGSELAPMVRAALWKARSELWPPMPGDRSLPYERAADAMRLTSAEVERLLYADRGGESILRKAPEIDGAALLDRYNLELARGVLLNARSLTLSARAGWRGIFASVKLARLMYRVERVAAPGKRRGSIYRVELSGPAAPFIVRPERYGARLARVVPALVRTRGWSLEAELGDLTIRGHRESGLRFRLNAATAPFAVRRPRTRYDSRWERALAFDFGRLMKEERQGWRLEREVTPVALGSELFLPDFTLRHADGCEVVVEVVGFWTAEYLETKLRKVRESGIENIVLVVFRGLAVGAGGKELGTGDASGARIVWFTNKPRVREVLDAAELIAASHR